MKQLADRGIPVGLGLAPLIPALNESDIPDLLRRARDAGATGAFLGLLHLADEAWIVFRERLAEALPDRAGHILSALDDVRGGRLDEKRYHERMQGRGARWETTWRLFEVQCRRLGLEFGEELDRRRLRASHPRIVQGRLFDGFGDA